jgi:hypothetical protein
MCRWEKASTLFITGLLSVIGTVSAYANVVDNLYIAEVPVENQTLDARQTAITTGMRDVLVRISGRSLVLTVTPVEEALLLPKRYVQRFRYFDKKVAGVHQKHLRVEFDKKSINKLLRDNRLPVWGRNRPSTLLWLVIDNRRSRTLLTNDRQIKARQHIEAQAALRGLPLSLPLYDLTDRSNLKISDVWGNFEDPIMRASERYHSEAVLVGRVYKTYSNNWSGRWTLYSEGRRFDWESEGDTIKQALLPGISSTTDYLSTRYVQNDDENVNGEVLLKVTGLGSLKAYTRTVKYLDSLDVIIEVHPYVIEADNVIFKLSSRGGRLAVSKAVSLGHILEAQPTQELIQQSAVLPAGTPQVPLPELTPPDLTYILVP